MIPEPDDPKIPAALGMDQPDQEAIDDLVDSLLRHGTAQDFPPPEPEHHVPPPRRENGPRFRAEYTDVRSRTSERRIDQPPVPGYKDFPAIPYINFGNPPMPSKSKSQARLMAAAAHNPAFAKKVGVPTKVAKEFNRSDAKTGILKRKTSK